MKKLLVSVLITIAVPTGMALAGESGPKGPKGPKLERLTRELNLTTDQQAKVKTILEAEHAKKEALKAETDGKLKAVLTKEQYAKLEHK